MPATFNFVIAQEADLSSLLALKDACIARMGDKA